MVKKKTWGGQWTEEKLDAFEKYVKAYLKIMNANRDKYNWTIIYFDGFAGNGTRTEEEKQDEIDYTASLFGEDVKVEEINVYKGAAERVVRLSEQGIKGFDKYYFVDKDKNSCNALKEHLSKFIFSGDPFYIPKDANVAIKGLAKLMKSKYGCKSLVLLDPFGMQIDWTSIKALEGVDVDLWILIPTGVIVNRLLRRDYDSHKGFLHPEKLKSFFGLTESEIKEFFYVEEKQESLFGDDIRNVKLSDSIQRIAELYVKQLKTVFKEVTDYPLVLKSSTGRPLFHFVYASNSTTGKKIAEYIINQKQN